MTDAELPSPENVQRAWSPPQPRRQTATWVAVIALGLLCLAINLAAYPACAALQDRYGWRATEWFVPLGLGVFGGEIALLSALIVWANGNLFVRLGAGWLVGLAGFGCWYAGGEMALAQRPRNWELDLHRSESLIILAALPLISLALQLPQWWMRIYPHWGLAKTGAPPSFVSGHSLSIRDLLAGTAIVAVTLAVARFSADGRPDSAGFWLAWTIAFGVLIAVSQLILMPLIAFILRWRFDLLAIAFIFIAPICLPLLLAVTATIEGDNLPDEAYPQGYLAALACFATFSAPLWIARLAGYRLVKGRTASVVNASVVELPESIS